MQNYCDDREGLHAMASTSLSLATNELETRFPHGLWAVDNRKVSISPPCRV
jgi:hypothetical protein